MQYGYFDDKEREYVITSPATPFPWINYLGNEDFFGLISNTAGGYTFYKDAKFRRITRYRYNGVPMDAGGRYFYIKDGDTVWNPGWKPCKTPLDSYECRHGMNYTRITGEKNGIKASVLFFVPLGTHAEVQNVTLTNTTTNTKTIKLFSFIEWCLWNAQTDMENFQRNWSTGEVEIDGATIYHKTEYKERRNHYAYYALTNARVNGFDTDRESFLGLYNGFDTPQVVTEGQARNSVAHGWSPVASHYLEVELAPGESRDLIFLLGYAENEQDKKFDEKELVRKQAGELLCSQESDHTLINKELTSTDIEERDTARILSEVYGTEEVVQLRGDALSGKYISANERTYKGTLANKFEEKNVFVGIVKNESKERDDLLNGVSKEYHTGPAISSDINILQLRYFAPSIGNKIYGYYKITGIKQDHKNGDKHESFRLYFSLADYRKLEKATSFDFTDVVYGKMVSLRDIKQ